MIKEMIGILKKNEIDKIYFLAIILFLLPLISLGIFILDQLTVNKTEMIFWLLFLVGMLPCGLLGTVLSIFGLRKAIKNKSVLNKSIGIIGIVGGLIYFGGGLLGIMLIYVVIGG